MKQRLTTTTHAFSVLAATALFGLSGVASAQQTINPEGGVTTEDGLRIVIQPDTSVQIFQHGQRQAYAPNGEQFRLAVGATAPATWTNVSQSAVTGDGTPASPWQVVTTVSANGFTVAYTIRSIRLDPTLDVEAVVTPPASNTEVVKVYQYADSYLAGGDSGAAFWLPGGGPPPPAVPTVVGVTKPVADSTQFQVLVVGNRPWDHYYSGPFGAGHGAMVSGGDLSDGLDTNVNTDNGFGVQWTLGPITAPETIRYRWSFSATPVAPVCGDGTRAAFEGCDDGNTTSGDGCDAICQQENGWACTGTAPSACTTVCGNGVLTGAEACDDNNSAAGDGCSATCTVEDGFTCAGAGACTPICGNSTTQAPETCDDGNTTAGDGCSATCTAEDGFTCTGASCTPICGNSVVNAPETCDDGNTTAGDGCSATCTTEAAASSGCGCTVAGQSESRTSMVFLLAGLGLVIEARRRQRAAR